MRAPAEVVAKERARVATEGWGARLLALQGHDGQWAGGACFPGDYFNDRDQYDGQPWISTLPTLQLLHDFGIDPGDERVRRAVAMVKDHCRWEHAGQRFFDGEVEPCINGRVVTLGTYFDQDVNGIVARLLGEQLEDGGWNCEAENGSVRSSLDTTINVLEGLLVHERATGGSAEAISARRRGEEYLLERKLFRRKSTGEMVAPAWLRFSFPTRWHYDVLRALDYFRSARDEPDSRMDEATGMLASWVMQAGFDPPMITVAVNRKRYVCDWLTEGQPFVLNVVAEGQGHLLKHFGKGFEPGQPAFAGLETRAGDNGVPALTRYERFVVTVEQSRR